MGKTAIAAGPDFVMVDTSKSGLPHQRDIAEVNQRLLGSRPFDQVQNLQNDPKQNIQELAKEFKKFETALAEKGLNTAQVGIATITASRTQGTNNEFSPYLVLTNGKKIPVNIYELRALTKIIGERTTREEAKLEVDTFIKTKTPQK